MRLIYFFVSICIGLGCSCAFANTNFIKFGNIKQKEWSSGYVMVSGNLISAPNTNNCNSTESVPDRSVEFDITNILQAAGTNFDVNNIYVDGLGGGADLALEIWLTEWSAHIFKRELQPLLSSNDWSGETKIRICLGGLSYNAVGPQNEIAFRGIVFWYDGPVETTGVNYPKDKAPKGSDMLNITKPADALIASKNGVRLFHLNGSGISTYETEPPTLSKPDFYTEKVYLTTISGVEKYSYSITDEVKMNAIFKNKGDANIPGSSYMYSRFYLSKGYKEDSHNVWVRVGTDQTLGSNLKMGAVGANEQEGLKLWNQDIVKPGKTYNVIACADRTADQYNSNGDWVEKHESNNCSTPAVFTVNGIFNFSMNSLLVSGGKTKLNVGDSYDISASVSNVSNNTPEELRVGYFLSGGAMQGEEILGTHLVTETEFVSGFTKSLSLASLKVPSTAGTYTLKACIDYDERVFETSENDNCLYKTFTVVTPVVLNPAPKKAKAAVFSVLFGS